MADRLSYHEELRKRRRVIMQMRKDGYTLQQIADEFGITRARVHSILKRQKEKADRIDATGDSYLAEQDDAVIERCKRPLTLADRLLSKRVKASLTRKELSRASGVSYSLLGAYEQGRSDPSVKNLIALCTALNCNAHWVLFGVPFKRKR